MRFGYACIALGVPRTTNKTCRLKSARPERLRDLIADNLSALEEVLLYNQRVGLLRFRISSEIIPFGGHEVNRLPWWDMFASAFRYLGRIVRDTWQVVSMHPGHFTVLNSPDAEVLAASRRDLERHDRFLSAMELGPEHKLVVHVGGGYGDFAAAGRRFVETVAGLPEGLRRRLVVENEEHGWTPARVLPVARAAGVPVVLDAFHLKLSDGPGADLRGAAEAALATWSPADGTPKMHLSSQAPGRRPGTHADDIDPADFLELLDATAGLADFDVMFECKRKDLAVLEVIRTAEAAGRLQGAGGNTRGAWLRSPAGVG